jgi:hypothetical protein
MKKSDTCCDADDRGFGSLYANGRLILKTAAEV